MSGEFRWSSPLGASVALFLLSGALHALIGAVTPPMMDTEFGRKILLVSHRADTLFFGVEPTALLQRTPELARLRQVLSGFIGGSLLAVGLLIIAVAWFGLRQRQLWALATLSVTGLVLALFWGMSLRPYVKAGVPLTLADLPPVFWIPAAALVPATLLGWLGLR